jgi:hypothetical protein
LVLHVVYRHTSILHFKSSIALLWHALVGSISSLEEDGRRPVVGEIICWLASSACRELGWIHLPMTHIGHERVTTDYLMQMCGRYISWFDQWVKTVDNPEVGGKRLVHVSQIVRIDMQRTIGNSQSESAQDLGRPAPAN